MYKSQNKSGIFLAGTNMQQKGGPVHKAPASKGSNKGQIYTTLHPYMERLFPCFKPMTPRSQQSKFIIAAKLAFKKESVIVNLNSIKPLELMSQSPKDGYKSFRRNGSQALKVPKFWFWWY